MADGSISIDVGMNTSKARKQLDSLNQKISKLETELNNKGTEKSAIEEKLIRAQEEAERTKIHIEEMKGAIQDMEASLRGDKGSVEYDPLEFQELPNYIAKTKEDLAEAEKTLKEQEKTAASLTKEYEKISRNVSDGSKKLEEMKNSAGQLERVASQTDIGAGLAGSLDTAKKKLMTFLKYAVGIRSVYFLFRKLRQAIVSAVTEFAKADPETQKSINDLKASLAQLQVSWGAAFAPILNAVAPLLQKLIGWLNTAANAVGQIIAVLSGKSTYKKAVTNQNALAKGISGVGAAAEKASRQLMAFDELNVLQGENQTSGIGGGAEATGIDVTEEELSPLATWLADHLELIKDLAIAVGIALAAWTIGKLITQFTQLTPMMNTVLGLAMALGGAYLFVNGFGDAIQNGVNWENLTEMIAGCALAAVGLGIAFGTTWAAAALLVSAALMLTVGLKDWIEKGELSTETFWLLEAAIAAVGVAFALLLSPWSLLVAAFVAGGLAIYKNWDSIKDWFNEKVKPWFTVEKWRELGQKAMEAIRNGLNSISLPKFHFSWETTGYTGTFFGRQVTVNIPFPHLDWYARGGVFDKASMIGVGESGKEAVVPLERNTEWIDLVVDGVISRLKSSAVADAIAEAFVSTPMPAIAGGSIIPPNATCSAYGGDWGNSLMEEIKSLRSEISALASQPIQVSSKLYMDRREVGRGLTEYQREQARAGG